MEHTILSILQILSSIGLVGLVLLQQGKGADMGASFGAGASQTVFGASGSGNFMTRVTALFATVFFAASLGLAYLGKHEAGHSGQFNFGKPPEVRQIDELPTSEELEGDLPATEAMPPAEKDVPKSEESADESQ